VWAFGRAGEATIFPSRQLSIPRAPLITAPKIFQTDYDFSRLRLEIYCPIVLIVVNNFCQHSFWGAAIFFRDVS